MTNPLTRREALRAIALGSVSTCALGWNPAGSRANYRLRAGDDYGLRFTYPLEDLIGDLETGERGDPRREAAVEHRHWYSHDVRRRYGAWGPGARTYAPLKGLEARATEWRRERVIAAAARFIGYAYQHHHIPDWDPPADWPWKETCAGRNSKGFDCSNFTSFVYNQGFGIHMGSGIVRQSEAQRAMRNDGPGHTIHRVELPVEYDARLQVLRTGDLLYIRGREDGPITHVVLWVGTVGRAASGVPLVLDSHGSGVLDDDGRHIPCGVQLRPFRPHSWYARCASHAHRLFRDSQA
ncbi:MAG: NlpC/P60 family protein [Pirellulales bacterium]